MAKTIKREAEIEVRTALALEDQEPYHKDLLAALAELESLEAGKSAAVKTFGEAIKDEKAKVKEARRTLRDGKPEMKAVIAHYNFSTGRVRFADATTGKFYKDHERDVTDEDRQLTIGDEEGTEEAPEATTPA